MKAGKTVDQEALVPIDPLLQYVQDDAAHELAAAAANMAVTVELLRVAHRVAVATGASDGELPAAIERMSAVRDSLHEHAATLANAGRPAAYLAAPATATIWRSLISLYGAEQATTIRSRLLAAAGVDHDSEDPDTVMRVAQAMAVDGDPLLRLCGRSVQIRLATYAHLSAT